jgi:putative CocE/NonD family hydrolase
VRLFVGGERRWREASAWPLPEARERRLHLRSGGRAKGSGGDGRLDEQAPPEGEPVDRFTYDPSDPVPTRGGCLLGPGGGSLDQRSIEMRADVLCYTTAPLSQDLVVVGPVQVVLFAASNAPDSDFTAKLVDVDADGAAVNLCDGIRRCRWREGDSDPVWLEPDAPVRLAIDLCATAFRLPAGHRLRLEVSSSNFPRFDRNANTRAEPTSATAQESAPAEQTVFHDAPHPSHLVIPVLPE